MEAWWHSSFGHLCVRVGAGCAAGRGKSRRHYLKLAYFGQPRGRAGGGAAGCARLNRRLFAPCFPGFFADDVPRKLYIETVGCQMNVLDSEMVVASLRQHGYELVATSDEPDTILFNTCSVRQHAEDKIYSALGQACERCKQQHPDKVIGVLGCMAQKDQQLIFERAPLRRPGRRTGPTAADRRT